MSVYLQEFKSKKDIETEYGCKIPDDVKILLAWYGYGSYCGSSLVIFKQNDKLYEVNGGHCSCDGLEGQWDPEETTIAALRMRDVVGECDGSKKAQKKLNELLDNLEKK